MSNYTGYIYSITNELNGKSYIGKTNDLVRRWKEHCYSRGNTAILDKAFSKYGLEHFIFEIVAQIPFDNIEEMNSVLKQLEVYYISLYDTYHKGYNATIGGDGISCYHHSEETKKKIGEKQKGKIITEEQKAMCSLANKGRHHTEKAREAIRKALLNRDSEIQKRIADKLRGKERDHDMIMKGAAKRRKPVLQYSLEGKFIAKHDGAVFVNKNWEANIIACCKGRLNSAYGYLWRYKNGNDYPLSIVPPKVYHKANKAVIQYNKEGKKVNEYISATEASKITGIGRKSITNCLGSRSKSAGGYTWKYKEERRKTV